MESLLLVTLGLKVELPKARRQAPLSFPVNDQRGSGLSGIQSSDTQEDHR